MFKKIFSLILVILLIPCVNINAQEVTSADNNSTTEYAQGIISALYPDIIVKSDGSYTRSEFLSAVIGLMNFSGVTSGGDNKFSDVPSDSDFYNILSFGADFGLVSKADYFYPDSKITANDAITIAVRALGYDDYARNHGGYPIGYLKAANELDITDGISAAGNAELSYPEGLILLYNLLDVDIMEAKSFSGENVEYIKTEGNNFIYAYHKIRITEGIISANEYSGIYSRDEHCQNGYIKINNTLFKGECSELLGFNVRLYYNDDAAKTVVYAHKYENTELTFNLSDDVQLSSGSFYYFNEAGAKKKASLEAAYALIYNGKAISLGRFQTLSSDGRVWNFVNNNGDGIYDAVIVTDTEYMVASRVDTAEEIIYDYTKILDF